jgi:O-antigen ligase
VSDTPRGHAHPGRSVAAVLLLLLTVPWYPGWFDAELARRGIWLVLAGAMCAIRPDVVRSLRPGRGLAGIAGISFLAWLWIRALTAAPHPAAGFVSALDWTALALAFAAGRTLTGRGGEPAAYGPLVVPALVVVVVAGFGQTLGWLDLFVGGTAGAPVATLGNLNAASEFLAVAGACLAPWILLGREPDPGRSTPRAALVAILGAMLVAALATNGTRSGALALAISVAISCLVGRGLRPRTRLLGVLFALVVVGGTFGRRTILEAENEAILNAPGPAATAEDVTTRAGNAALARETTTATPSTIAVRLGLWRGAASMIAAAPWIGHGTGQFALDFPPYRDPREIEISSFQRQFRTAVEHPHDELLLVTAELGAVGLGLFALAVAGFGLAVWRRHGARRGVVLAAPVVAFAITALVRAPIGNAPVAALAAFWAGLLVAAPSSPRPAVGLGPFLRAAAIALGLTSIVVGAGRVVGQTAAGRFVVELARGPAADPDAGAWLDRAVEFDRTDPRLRRLRIRAAIARAIGTGGLTLEATAEALQGHVDWLQTHAAEEPETQAVTAEVATARGDRSAAAEAYRRWRAIDPGAPEPQLGLATLAAEEGALELATATLLDDPHPRLAARLVDHLIAFGQLRARVGDREGAERFAREASIALVARDLPLAAAAQPGPTRRAIAEAVQRLTDALDDPRCALAAAAFVRRVQDDPKRADLFARAIAPDSTTLSPPWRRLLAPLAACVEDLPEWQSALRRLGFDS